jgi:hypothetical protein
MDSQNYIVKDEYTFASIQKDELKTISEYVQYQDEF